MPNDPLSELHVTASSLHSIPKNILKLLPKPPKTGKKKSATDHLLFTIQQLHHHALKLHRSLYLHALHLKEKDNLLVKYKSQSMHFRSKLKSTSARWKKEKSLYLTKLGDVWIKIASRLNRMDLVEEMEQEWKNVDDYVKIEMNSAEQANGNAQNLNHRDGNTQGNSTAAGPHSPNRSMNTPSKHAPSVKSQDKSNDEEMVIRRDQAREEAHVDTLRDEGDVFHTDTQLVQFLKKYAAEGFLEPSMDEIKEAEEFKLLKARAEVDNMTMTDEMLTQWLWIFEHDPNLQEKIRRQNRFAGIEADSELTLYNQKHGKNGNGDDDEYDEYGRRRKKGRFRHRSRYIDGDDDLFDRTHGNASDDEDAKRRKNGSKNNINWDEHFDLNDPAHPDHPDHLKYIRSLQADARELEKLREEFERQKALMKKQAKELNQLKNKPKFISDIDERLLMERLYDYRRMIQDRDEEILRLREALRDREKRKLKRNGQLNVFQFIPLDNLYDMKLSDITDSSRCTRHPDVMHARPRTATSKRHPNPSSLIHHPPNDNDHPYEMPDVSEILKEEDSLKKDSTFMTSMDPSSIRRPKTATSVHGKLHPASVPHVKNASGRLNESSHLDASIRQNQSTSPPKLRSKSPDQQPSFTMGDTLRYQIAPPKKVERPQTASMKKKFKVRSKARNHRRRRPKTASLRKKRNNTTSFEVSGISTLNHNRTNGHSRTQ